MDLVVNGESRQFEGPLTAAGLLAALGLDSRAVVVELNRHIVRGPELTGTPLSPGDQVELVHFVGGG